MKLNALFGGLKETSVNACSMSFKMVAAMALCGLTYKAIGMKLNIPTERAHQWCRKGLNIVRLPENITSEIKAIHQAMSHDISRRQAHALMADAYLRVMFDFPENISELVPRSEAIDYANSDHRENLLQTRLFKGESYED